jgi:hypothetical protein
MSLFAHTLLFNKKKYSAMQLRRFTFIRFEGKKKNFKVYPPLRRLDNKVKKAALATPQALSKVNISLL